MSEPNRRCPICGERIITIIRKPFFLHDKSVYCPNCETWVRGGTMSEPNRCPKCDCELAEFDAEAHVLKCARCGYVLLYIVGIDEDGEYAQKSCGTCKQIAQLKAEVERLTTENGKACDSYQKWANEQGIYINQLLNDRDELSERLAKELHEHEVSMEEIERLTKLLSSIYKALVDYPIENGKAIVDVGNYNAVIEELKPFNKDGDG